MDSIAKRAAELGMPAVALTDHGRCGGLLQFKKACNKAGVKPILGCELYVAPTNRTVREKIDGHNTSYHLIVLAKNDEGLKNIFKLSSIGWLDGFYYKPRVDIETLKQYKDGLVVLSGCSSGMVANRFLEDKHDESKAYAKLLHKIWGEDFYIEVQNHGMDWQQPLRRWLFNLSNELNIPIVATQDSHFINHEDAVLHQKICKLAAGDLEFGTTEMYFKSYEEMCERFDEDERVALLETVDVAEKCNVNWDYGRTIWPVFPLEKGRTPEGEMRSRANDGFTALFGHGTEPYRARFAMELDIIEKMGFSTYFLVVSDFIHWARKNGIPVGPGRGSGAGSLVCLCLGITEVDPIKYGLYFERFLNPARISLPDLDIDFCPRGRKEVISYVADRYGGDRVAQIGTYAQFKPRGALRDFARVCGYEPTVGARLAELIPPDIAGKPLTFDEAIQAEPKLLQSQWLDVVDLARKSEGLRTKAGVHAAGVVISNDDLKGQVPLFRGRGDEVATQFDMHDVEEIGLVKYDFLGLINLTIIQDAIKLIKQHHRTEIDISKISDDDPEVFTNVFQTGRLDGIFQFETSSGFRDLCIRVKPRSIEDLSAITALFRPGPLCLSGDSEILVGIQTDKRGMRQLQKRNLKEFYKLFSSRTVAQHRQWPFWLISFNEETQSYRKNRIKAICASGKKHVFTIKTTTSLRHKETNTRRIKASIDHQFLTLKGWKKLKELCPGDYLCTFREEDNSPENLSFLCPNHHRIYSEGKIAREDLIYNRDKYKLPHSKDFTWIRFDGLEDAGEEETYDIEVEGPDHNFIADSFVVHNSTGLVDKYIVGRNGGRVDYLVPELEPILRETYGVMVYQEQIMQICTDLAGYSAAEADGMRKAIGKKIADMMAKQRDDFVNGCTKNGIDGKAATQLFDDIEGFAKYSFNKAHSVAYSVISYRTAWLKNYFPEEFYCSLLNNTIKEQGQLVKYIHSCKENGIAIEPPDVNRSGALFTIDSGTILFGLGGIKGIGEKTCERLLENRGEGFTSLLSLISAGASSKDVKGLAMAGALEGISDLGRESIVEGVDELIKYSNKLLKWEERSTRFEEREAQIKAAIKDGHKPPKHLPKLPPRPEEPILKQSHTLSKEERLRLERETLGFYLTGHPLDSYPDLYRIASHNLEGVLDSGINGEPVRFPAVVSVLTKKRTRKGKDMATLLVEDKSARAEVTIFPSTWNKLKDRIQEEMVAIFSCKVDRESNVGEETSLVRLVLSDFHAVTDPTVFEAKRMEDLNLSLPEGGNVRFIVTERTPRDGWQRAIAILNNLENKK